MNEDFAKSYLSNPIVPSSPETGILSRAAYHLATAVPRAVTNTIGGVETLLGAPPSEPSQDDSGYQVGIDPATSTSGKVVDFLGGGILPLALELGGINKFLTPFLPAKYPALSMMAKDAVGFGMIGAQQDRTTALEQAGEGAAYGVLSLLPRVRRILPAALLGLGSKLFFDRNGEEPIIGNATQGDLAGTIGALGAMVPGQNKWRAPLMDYFKPKIGDPNIFPANPAWRTANPWTSTTGLPPEAVRAVGPPMPFEPGIAPANWAHTRAPGPITDFATSAKPLEGPILPEFPEPGPMAPNVFTDIKPQASSGLLPMEDVIGQARQAITDTATKELNVMNSLGHAEPGPRIIRPEYDPTGGDSLLQKTKGKLRPLAQGQEPNTGGYITSTLSQAMGRAATGALIGGAIGAPTTPGENTGFATGAIVGGSAALFGPEILRSVVEAKQQAVKRLQGGVGAGTWDAGNIWERARLHKYRGEDTFLDRSLVRLDDWFKLNRSESVKRALGQARGIAGYQIEGMENSLRKMTLGFQPDDALKKTTMSYLEGTLDEASYLQSLQNAPSAAQAYGKFAIEARGAMDGLITVAAQNVGSASRSKMMLDSVGEYMRQSYKLFSGKFIPDENTIEALAQKLKGNADWSGLTHDGIKESLRQYANDIQQAKKVYRPFSAKTTGGAKIDQTLFRHRTALDQEWKDFLGEVTDPVDRVQMTLMKLRPLAESASFMGKALDNLKVGDTGLPAVFHDRALLEAAQKANAHPDLQMYKYVQDDYRYGSLKGKLVHPQIADVLDEWEGATAFDSAHTRWMTGINRLMKSNVTYRNPAAIARQFLGAPLFAMIARANPIHWAETMRGMSDTASPLRKELIENGIVGADYISRDVMREVTQISNGLANYNTNGAGKAILGHIDSRILGTMGMVGSVDRKLADLFRFPDTFVRAGAYVSAKYRIAKELGKALDHPDVINKAVEHTNRYTMNYDLVSPAIKTLRNVPGISMFLTFSAEMARISKNMVEDVLKGNMGARTNALLSLGTLAALPAAMEQSGEESLSEKDREDWKKVKSSLPAYSKYRYKVVTGRDKKTGSFNVIDFSSIVPTDNYAQMIRALSEGNVGDALKVNPVAGWDNNPVMNIFAQQIAGEDRYTKRKFRGGADRFANVAKEIGGPLTPGPTGGSLWRAGEQAFSVNASGEQGLTDKSGRRLVPADFFARLAGVGSGQYNLQAIQRSQVAEAKSDVANEMAYLQDVLRSDSPLQTKQAAAERTKIAVQGIREKLLLQLGMSQDHTSPENTEAASPRQ